MGPHLSRQARVTFLVFVLVLLAGVTAAYAEPPQFWLPVSVGVKVAPKWTLAVQVEPRWDSGGDREMDRVLFRPAAVCEPLSGLTIWAGYGYTEVRAERLPDDQLLWQQVVYTFKAGGWTLAPRVRVEERFIERADGVAWRLRTHFRAMHPLPHATGWSVVAWHESFIPMNSVIGAQSGGFSQGRFFAGVQRRIDSHVTVEPGYLALLNHRPGPLPDEWEHVVSVGIQVRF